MIMQQKQLSFHVSRIPSPVNWKQLLYGPAWVELFPTLIKLVYLLQAR